jgi:hypothetical protein
LSAPIGAVAGGARMNRIAKSAIPRNNSLQIRRIAVTAAYDKPPSFFMPPHEEAIKGWTGRCQVQPFNGARMSCKIVTVVIALCVLTAYLSWTEAPSASAPWPEIHTDKTSRLAR